MLLVLCCAIVLVILCFVVCAIDKLFNFLTPPMPYVIPVHRRSPAREKEERKVVCDFFISDVAVCAFDVALYVI